MVKEVNCEEPFNSGVREKPQVDIIGRQLRRSDGVYIEGAIQGTNVCFTTDTGVARTVISAKLYRRIPEARRPDLKESRSLAGADGQPLVELGKAVFTISLGQLTLERELVVAETEDEALLGLDILMKGKDGPADIKLTEGVINLNGIEIPCTEIGRSVVRKIRCVDHFKIPPQSEILVEVFVDKFDDDDTTKPQIFLLEPTEHFCLTCLVEIGQNTTSKVRLINPFDFEAELKQDTVIGTAEEVVKEPMMLFHSEDNQERNNYNRIRRIKLSNQCPGTKPINNVIKKLSEKTHLNDERSDNVPLHLMELFEHAAKGRSDNEKKAIATLLNKFTNAFSKDENDLGCTGLVEFSIDTGDTGPIKQLPRRVPMAFAEEEKKLISNMERQGIIQKSNSPWSSPLVLVVKKNGKIRPCVDYRRLNVVTVKDAFPLPRIQDCLDTVRGSTLFSTFDLTSRFHQIPVKPSDTPKTAFVTKYGLYGFLTMPFGVCNGPKLARG